MPSLVDLFAHGQAVATVRGSGADVSGYKVLNET